MMKMQVKAESMILNGDPREMICEAAEQMQVNLLVLGSRGLGALKRFQLLPLQLHFLG